MLDFTITETVFLFNESNCRFAPSDWVQHGVVLKNRAEELEGERNDEI
jgi:hypothetical protein